MNNELYHYGILGMKWGVRRYQNADGSLTAAGRKRYGSDSSGTSERQRKRELKKTIKDLSKSKTSSDGSSTKIIGNSGRALSETSRAINTSLKIYDRNKEVPKELSEMSDEELRKIVSRYNNEQRYMEMNKSDVEKGMETAADILSVAGSVAAAAASVGTIVYLIKNKE